jgi:NAD-dependent histone deacetylase SIR2
VNAAHCTECKAKFDITSMRDHIRRGEPAKCASCPGYAKPDVILFGETLPPNFAKSASKIEKADLLIVMGTSLKVGTVNRLIESVAKRGKPIIVIDRSLPDGLKRRNVTLLQGTSD